MKLRYCTEHLQVTLIFSLVITVASKSQVLCTNTSPAVLGGDVILSCEFQAHLDVLQITWQKKKGKNTQNMVTYSEKYGGNIAAPFQGHVSILSANSSNSSIKISKLKKEDEGCYLCLFNAYPGGAFQGEVYLNKIRPSLDEHPNKVVLVAEELDMEGANKDDQEIHETQQQRYSRVWYPIILGAVILVMVILILLHYKTWRKQEPVTPKKLDKAETGQVTPIQFKNRSDEVNNGSTKVVNSSLYSPMNDSEVETPLSSKVTPRRSIHKESPDSLLNQRKRQTPGTPTCAKRLKY